MLFKQNFDKMKISNYEFCDFYLYDKNYSQNALFFIFIINKRQFYCLYFAYNIERLNAH